MMSLLASLLLLPQVLQEDTPAKVGLPGETLVSAPRAGARATDSQAHLTQVSGEELRRTGERSLPRALAAASGVWVQETNLGGGAPFIRGLVGNQVLLLVDGVRINDSTTRSGPNQSLNTIDPEIVERVEIIRGPSSVLYGSDAIGGVISVWTRRRLPGLLAPLERTGFDGALGGEYQSAVEGGRASGELSFSSERDGVLVIGDVFDLDDLESADGTEEFTGYGGSGLFGSWVHAFDRWRSLTASLRLHRDEDVPRTDKLVPGFGQSTASNSRFEFDEQERQGWLLRLDDARSGGFYDRAQLRLSYRRYVERREEQKFGKDLFSLERDEVRTVGLGVEFQRALGHGHLLTFGLDVDSDEVDSTDTETDLLTGATSTGNGDFAPDARYTSVGLFVQDEVFTLEPWDVTLGGRASVFDFSFDPFPGGSTDVDGEGSFRALSLSLQAARDLSPGARIAGSLAQGFRAPNLDELAKNGSFFGGEELANPDLDPERSLTAELSLDLRAERWGVGTAVYYTRIRDLIGRRLVEAGSLGSELFERENAGRADIWGAEASGRWSLGQTPGPFALEAGMAWARGRQHDESLDPATGSAPLDGVELRRVPPLHGHLSVVYDAAEPQSRLGWGRLELSWADDQDQLHPDDVKDPRIDPDGTAGYGLLGFQLGGRLGGPSSRSSWHAGVHNILDRSYRVHGSGFDGPGRSILAGLRWRP